MANEARIGLSKLGLTGSGQGQAMAVALTVPKSRGDKPGILEFILTGFKQTQNVRHYQFQVIGADRTRRDVSVDADLDVMRKHGISIQEMPLLCRRLLEESEAARALDQSHGAVTVSETSTAEVLLFSSEDMAVHARGRAAAKLEQELKRKRPNRPPSPNRQPGAHSFGSGAPIASNGGASGNGRGPGNAI